MTRQQRVLAALNHRETAQVPIDFGSTPTTGIHVSVVAGLRDYFGLAKRLVKVCEPYQMLGLIEDDLKDALGIDTEGVTPRCGIFGFPNVDWQTWRAPWGQEMLVSREFRTTTDSSGDVFIYPAGDPTVSPSGHMPKTGYFFDAIIRQPPIDEDKLNPEDNLEEFGPLSEEDLAHYTREIDAASRTGRAVVAVMPGMGLGDIALVPGPFMRRPKGIRDVAEWYMSTATRQDYVHAVFSKQTDIAVGNLRRLHSAVGNKIDVAFICGTDFGTQSSQFCSADTFRSLYKPYYARINQWIHQHTTWKTFKHSCGAIGPFLTDFIEAGFDIINPVQCSATGMDPRVLKDKYGPKLVFWGGGVDTQRVLPFGSPDQVRQQVQERCDTFARGGGFVFNTIHNIQARTPVENVVAMLDVVHGHVAV